MPPDEVVWQPHPGSQTLFLSCPVWELLFDGTRGPGKTTSLLADFAQHCGQGHGPHWRGVLFRQTYKQLDDVVVKSKLLYRRVFPEARFIQSKSEYKWVWPTGEELLLRHIRREADYWDYHGHEYPWIGFDELTTWASPAVYDMMKACSRSSHPGMPRKYRATTNPWGVGHNWVKDRFVDPAPAGTIITDEEGKQRVRLHGHYTENTTMMAAEPDYRATIIAAAGGDPNIVKAWLNGSWDIVAGGMFDDVWNRDIHVLRPFPIPRSWYIDRSFDWGSARPFSVGWWAESDGTELKDGRSWPRGTLFRISEWYGWNGKPDQGSKMLAVDIAAGILRREKDMEYKVRPGPADTSIYDVENGHSIGDDMLKAGVRWERADKKPGSRINGWERTRMMLKNAKEGREKPGLYVFDRCAHFIRTFPVLPRDEVKMDDVDTDAEDHIADETRYRVLAKRRTASTFRHGI